MVGRAATRRRRASPESGAGSGKEPKDLEVTAKRAKRVKGGGTMLEYLRPSATPTLTSGLGTTTPVREFCYVRSLARRAAGQARRPRLRPRAGAER